MSALSDGFRAAIKEMLEADGLEVATILSWEEDVDDSFSACETCGPEPTKVHVTYTTDHRPLPDAENTKTWTWTGTFGEMLDMLLADEK